MIQHLAGRGFLCKADMIVQHISWGESSANVSLLGKMFSVIKYISFDTYVITLKRLGWFVVEVFFPDLYSICCMCTKIMALSIIDYTTEGLFVKSQSPPLLFL